MALLDIAKKIWNLMQPVMEGSKSTYGGTDFMAILSENFPGYEVRQNVPMPGSQNGVPVSYLLSFGGRPVLAIILCSSREYDRSWITATMTACQRQGIPVQRYYREFRNDPDYVVQRIRRAL